MASLPSTSCVVAGRKPWLLYEGKMIEYFLEDSQKYSYAAFFGIPYADRPVGMDRYKAPKSCTLSHTGPSPPLLRCTEFSKISVQFNPPEFKGSSDCLYLNIFIPTRPEDIRELLPVLVYIHGGGFIRGSNDPEEYTPDNILHQRIVFVTISYRLGLFGFMNTGTRDCPGNAGLKDQVKALEWIRDNIDCFKGDPNNVTISGNGAGATCVNLHLIAPASQDLFHKAIVQSGGMKANWGLKYFRDQLVEILSKDQRFRDLFALEEERKEFQQRAYDVLEEYVREGFPRAFTLFFGPTVENFEDGAFISENIDAMMRKVTHDKPVMAGITKEEGIAYVMRDFPPSLLKEWVNDDTKFCQILMEIFHWSEDTARRHLHEIRDKYFPGWRNDLSDTDFLRRFANLVRDVNHRSFYDNFKFGLEATVHKNLYVYRFDHVSSLSLIHRSPTMTHYFNDATRGDELKYLYCPLRLILKRRSLKKVYQRALEMYDVTIPLVENRMASLWASFCKTGIPESSDSNSKHVEWKRHTEENPCYLKINKDLKLERKPLFEDEWNWLNSLVNSEPV